VEVAHDFLMTRGAFIRADELRPGNAGRCHDGARGRATGEREQSESGAATANPEKFPPHAAGPDG
jgi:hypothetical protein